LLTGIPAHNRVVAYGRVILNKRKVMKKKYINDDELFNLMNSMDHNLAGAAYNIINYIPAMKAHGYSEKYIIDLILQMIDRDSLYKNRLLEASDIIFFIPKEMLNKDQRKIQNLLRKHL
jgi:hypothetical protein